MSAVCSLGPACLLLSRGLVRRFSAVGLLTPTFAHAQCMHTGTKLEPFPWLRLLIETIRRSSFSTYLSRRVVTCGCKSRQGTHAPALKFGAGDFCCVLPFQEMLCATCPFRPKWPKAYTPQLSYFIKYYLHAFGTYMAGKTNQNKQRKYCPIRISISTIIFIIFSISTHLARAEIEI